MNTIIVGFFAIANFSTLIWSLATSNDGISGNNIFQEGDCTRISQLNTFLHLLLNIASSLIIASSNFFMQVLNSPTRAEVDQAHSRKYWLEIGVPSLRNVLHVSPYKSLAWALFSLSSIPIHLLFNSSVFTVDYSGSAWSMALVSEPLLHGAPYSVPGAALVPNGTFCQLIDNSTHIYYNTEYMDVSEGFGYGDEGYIPQIDGRWFDAIIHEYSDPSQRLTAVTSTAKQRLSVSECKSEFQTCQGLRKYRNLLLVIDLGDGPTNSQGWVLDEIYNMAESFHFSGDIYNSSTFVGNNNKLENKTFSSIWGRYSRNASISQPNSLWFSSECYKFAAPSLSGGCYNSCGGPLGIANSRLKPDINETSPNWTYPWWPASNWRHTWWPVNQFNLQWNGSFSWSSTDAKTWAQGYYDDFGSWPYWCKGGPPRPSYRNSSANNIRVQYCLAEPYVKNCKAGISNVILLVVNACVFAKFLLCIFVVFALGDDPLVTPGDAMASFISIPDPTTVGRCAATLSDIRIGSSGRKPCHWQNRPTRLARTASLPTWARNYVFFVLLLCILGFMMNAAFLNYPLSAV